MYVRKMTSAALLVLVVGAAACAGCTSVYDEAHTLLEGGGGKGGGTGVGNTGGTAADSGGAGTTGPIGSGGAAGADTGAGERTVVCGNGQVEPGEQCDDGNHAGDDGCSDTCHLEGGSCDDTVDVALGNGTLPVFQGTTAGGTTISVACDKQGPHRIYAVTPATDGFLTASLAPKTAAFDSALYILDTCGSDAFLACADGASSEIASIEVAAGTPVYVVVGGASETDQGDYELTLDLSAGDDCTDPIPLRIEQGTGVDLRGSTAGKTNDAKCKGGAGTWPADVVYQATMVAAGAYQVTLKGEYSSLLYTRAICADGSTELACENVQGIDDISGEELDVLVQDSGGDLAPGNDVFLWVDGTKWTTPSEGPYRLGITHIP